VIPKGAHGVGGLWEKFTHWKPSLRFGVSADELAMLCEVLKALYSSGLPILQAIQMTIEETPNPRLRKRLVTVLNRLKVGDDLATAMSDKSCLKDFPPLMRETIRTGQMNGRLGLSLERLAQIYQRQSETKRETVSALVYPGLALLVFVVVCTTITILVPTALTEIVGKADLDKVYAKLPGPIRFLFFLHDHPVYLVIPPGLIVFVAALWPIGKRYHATRIALNRVERRVPAIGSILYQFALVRFLDQLSANNATGIMVAESLSLISRSISDALIEDALLRMRGRILSAGLSLGTALGSEPVFPSLVKQMVVAGENSGQLTEMLGPISVFYESRAKASLKRALDMITPLMIIALGCILGPVVVGMYKALFLLAEVGAGGVEALAK
jgi:type IV pilus assembly protein PilC